MEKNVFHYPVNCDITTYDNIRNFATGQGDHYTTGCLLDHNYFNHYYKMTAIDLNKQQALDGDRKAIQQMKFYWKSISSRRCNNVFHIEEA